LSRWRVAVVADPVFESDDERLRGVGVSPSPIPETSDARRGLDHDPALDRYRRLPQTRVEAQAILSLVPESHRFQALDFDANRDVVMSGTLAGYDIVHFATHGLLNTARPELSGLVLSLVDRLGQRQTAGYLRLFEIYNMDINAELVVLSACRTALGKEIRGEGLIGLTRGFMYAGASRVMVSLWNISDVATATLMEHFYRALLEDGERPAQALRTAQRAMLADPRTSDPYYWAPFVLQGTWR
jgi:CHAT domain-containing protein